MGHVDAGARNALAVCCAASAGVHAALVPEHLAENTILGTGFALAAVCLFASTLAFAGTRAPSPAAAPATALLLVALISAYVVSRTAGVPLIGTEVEEVDAVGLTTQALQAAGLAAALVLTKPAFAVPALARGKETRTCDSPDS
jgi:hypothetical protein